MIKIPLYPPLEKGETQGMQNDLFLLSSSRSLPFAKGEPEGISDSSPLVSGFQGQKGEAQRMRDNLPLGPILDFPPLCQRGAGGDF
jgi:hypothetical protein